MRVNTQEITRLRLGLRADGWSEKKIKDFLLFIETGGKQYKQNGTDADNTED